MTKYKNPQEWLNHQYASKKKIKRIDLKNLKFNQPSELTIDNYPKLKEIKGNNVSNLTKLTINNCSQLEKVYISSFKNNQQLILNNLPNLRELICSNSELTGLDLTEFSNLQTIDCRNNQLTQIKLPSLGKKLERLNLSNNNFNQDLSFLRDLVNLKGLGLSNNHFYGSLQPLQGLVKLKWLDIGDTDIDSGLEFLPEGIENFWCSVDRRTDAKVKTIYNLFADEWGEVEIEEKFGIEYIKDFSQKLQDYKQEAHQLLQGEFNQLKQNLNQLEEKLDEKDVKLRSVKQKKNYLAVENSRLTTSLQEKIKQLELKDKLFLGQTGENNDSQERKNNDISQLSNEFAKLEVAKERAEELEQEVANKKIGLEKQLATDNYEKLIKEIDQETNNWEQSWKAEKLAEEAKIQVKIQTFLGEIKINEKAKEIIEKILWLKWEIKHKQDEIKKLKKEIEGLKTKFEIKKKEIEKEIERTERSLNSEKIECIDKMNHEGYPIEDWRKGNYAEWIEELLEVQEIITNKPSNNLVERNEQKKKNFIKEGHKLSDKLEKLCKLKDELIKLEIQLNNTDKNQIFITNKIGFAVGDNSNVGDVSLSNNEINYQSAKQQTQIIQTNLPNFQNK